ncbi:WD40 repeat domain-containing protein [Arachnia propionica]|uniref:WD40 repeat domain-containing protein n=1 Tax=Arachnia propionica TaxID=1750 RepID=A0A3P1T498_9ACTN|nr:WD40 repeat domain-containing protein [Arachnia propionica]RRD04160.1 WD40 repeat domain-containing protein [Arachnia propionica]
MRHRIRYRRITAPDAVDLGEATPGTVALASYTVKGRVQVVTCTAEEVLRVWDADTGALLVGPFQALPDASRHALLGEAARSLTCLDIDGGPRLVSSLNIDSVQLWDPEEGHLVRHPVQFGDSPRPVVAVLGLETASGPRLAVAEDGHIHLIDATTGESDAPPLELVGHRVVALETLPSRAGNTLLVAGSSDGTIRAWCPDSGERVGRDVQVSPEFTTLLPFIPDGGGLAVAVLDQDLECWSLDSGSLLHSWEANWNAAMADLPGVGPVAISVDSGGRATVWHIRAGEEIVTLGTEPGSGLRSAFPAGDHLALDFHDRIELWEPHGWRRVTTVSPRRPGSASEVANVLSLLALPDGRLALGLEDGWAVVDFTQA